MAVKTDMSKAYDRIEWSFLKAVFLRFGFHELWTDWVLNCVSSVNYSFLINGSLQGQVIPSRGLRQGDPLSPYLFILCTEVLSGLCKNAQVKGTLLGMRVARRSPLINHLLFADDTMFFSKTSVKSCETLMTILKRYKSASGQCINVAKSGITFSSKTPLEVKERVKKILGITNEGGIGKYLGLPEHFGRKKKDIFTGIVDKVRQRTLSWSTRFLSGAGKLVLLKAVLAAMPSYAMSCFKLPLSLCKRLQSAFTRFWWDDKPDKRKMSWVAWEKLTSLKSEGGLGFRDLATFNDSLLAKIGWNLIRKPNSLLAKVLLGKYCHSSPFIEVSTLSNASHGWRGILAGRDILRKGLGWIVGNGEDINVWNSPWLSTSTPRCPLGPPNKDSLNFKVKDLLCSQTLQWNRVEILKFLPHHEEDILSLVLSSTHRPDKLRWLPVKSGSYSTKSGYAVARGDPAQAPAEDFNWKSNIWKVNTSPKIRMFLWKATRKALPVGTALSSRGIVAETARKRCGQLEDAVHIFLSCSYAAKVWDLAPVLHKPRSEDCPSVKKLLEKARASLSLPPVGLGTAPLFPWILWFL